MPKMVRTQRERAKSALAGNIKKHMETEQVSDVYLAELIGVKSVQTFRLKLKNDDRCFDWEELRVLFKRLNFSDEEIMECMRG